uniref:Putative salivary lipocalin n=1 Tax=Rhipicephalus pulchellus TaxID=72859 RepID=L7LR69_RHIPC
MVRLACTISIFLLHVTTSFAEDSKAYPAKQPNGWDFLKEDVTLYLVARNYDLYGDNKTDCLISKTVSKDNQSHKLSQELHFKNTSGSQWYKGIVNMTAYRDDHGVYNFMNTTTGARYNFLYTDGECGVVEVLYNNHIKSSPTTSSTNDTKRSNEGRLCAIWVTEGALSKAHDDCWHSFRCECDNKSIYPAFNRTECKNRADTETRN